jgi:D-glycero-alpha-D-manno-heptose 1-phosphate guanylyltransferase
MAESNTVKSVGIMPPALVLVGGLGTRLRKVVSDRPKPMATIQGRPFLEWLVRYLKEQGIEKLIFAAGYMAEMIQEHFGDGSLFGLSIEYSLEDEPLGTGGAIRHAAPSLTEDRFFLINGDTLFAADLSAMCAAHERLDAHLTLAMHFVDNNSRYGQVLLNGECIIGFLEKPADPTPSWINGGIFLMNRDVLDRFPDQKKFSFETDVLPSLVVEQVCVGVQQDAYFVDIGLPETYFAFERDLPELLAKGLFAPLT